MVRFLLVGVSATGVFLFLRAVVAWLSGFLFGVTYRYTVRSEPANPFLKDGVVLAFTLVRGLAPVETVDSSFDGPLLIVLVIESLLCFAIARLTLDRVFKL